MCHKCVKCNTELFAARKPENELSKLKAKEHLPRINLVIKNEQVNSFRIIQKRGKTPGVTFWSALGEIETRSNVFGGSKQGQDL